MGYRKLLKGACRWLSGRLLAPFSVRTTNIPAVNRDTAENLTHPTCARFRGLMGMAGVSPRVTVTILLRSLERQWWPTLEFRRPQRGPAAGHLGASPFLGSWNSEGSLCILPHLCCQDCTRGHFLLFPCHPCPSSFKARPGCSLPEVKGAVVIC